MTAFWLTSDLWRRGTRYPRPSGVTGAGEIGAGPVSSATLLVNLRSVAESGRTKSSAPRGGLRRR